MQTALGLLRRSCRAAVAARWRGPRLQDVLVLTEELVQPATEPRDTLTEVRVLVLRLIQCAFRPLELRCECHVLRFALLELPSEFGDLVLVPPQDLFVL